MNADEILSDFDLGLFDADVLSRKSKVEEPKEDLYSEEELKAKIEEMKAQGVTEYPLMDI